jgi:hypothetical protein
MQLEVETTDGTPATASVQIDGKQVLDVAAVDFHIDGDAAQTVLTLDMPAIKVAGLIPTALVCTHCGQQIPELA